MTGVSYACSVDNEAGMALGMAGAMMTKATLANKTSVTHEASMANGYMMTTYVTHAMKQELLWTFMQKAVGR